MPVRATARCPPSLRHYWRLWVPRQRRTKMTESGFGNCSRPPSSTRCWNRGGNASGRSSDLSAQVLKDSRFVTTASFCGVGVCFQSRWWQRSSRINAPLCSDVDKRALERTDAGSTLDAGASHHGDGDAPGDGAWQERIARYVSVSNGGGDDQDREDRERSIEAKERTDQQGDERHLLFVSTSRGYQLVEQDGPAPAAFGDVTVPGHEGLFRVVKVAGLAPS